MTDPCTAGLTSLAQYLWTQIWAKRHRQHSMSYEKVGQNRPNVQFKPSSPISRCRVHIMSKPGFSASFFSPRMSETEPKLSCVAAYHTKTIRGGYPKDKHILSTQRRLHEVLPYQQASTGALINGSDAEYNHQRDQVEPANQ